MMSKKVNKLSKLSEEFLKLADVDSKTFPHGYGSKTSATDLGDKATQDRLLAWSLINSSFASLPNMAPWAPGDVDGAWGPRSKAMLLNFKNSMNLPDLTDSQAKAFLAKEFPTGTNSDYNIEDPFKQKSSKDSAKQAYQEGLAYISSGDYDKGIAHLQQAYEISPHPNTIYSIAQAYSQKGDVENALTYFKKYLEFNTPDKSKVESMIASLQARFDKAKQAKDIAEKATIFPEMKKTKASILLANQINKKYNLKS